MNKKVQLVTAMLREQRSLFLDLEARPMDKEGELHQGRILVERVKKSMYLAEVVIDLKLARTDILHRKGRGLAQNAHLLFPKELPLRIQPLAQPLIQKLGIPQRQGQRPSGRLQRIAHHRVNEFVTSQILEVDLEYPLLIGNQIGKNGRGIRQKIKIGKGGHIDRHPLAFRRHLTGRGRGTGCRNLPLGAKRLSLHGKLFPRVGLPHRPRIEQHGRPVRHHTRILFLGTTIKHIAVLIANVSACHIHRRRATRIHPIQFRRPDLVHLCKRRQTRLIPRSKKMDPGKRRGVLDPNHQRVPLDPHLPHRKRLKRKHPQIARLPENMTGNHLSLDNADAYRFASGLDP